MMERFRGRYRYFAPNAVTSLNILFGILALIATAEHRYADSAWWIIYAVCTDRVDGFIARLVKGSSELGMQLDSLADFLNFGVAPAFLIFSYLGQAEQLPFTSGAGRLLLMSACIVWVLAGAFRLARFNVVSTDKPAAPAAGDAPQDADKLKTGMFFGVPTTLAAGLLMIWFLALCKYAGPGMAHGTGDWGWEPRLFGDWTVPLAVWRYFPLTLFIGAFLMTSNVRMPKLGASHSRWFTIFVIANVIYGYIGCYGRIMPEFLVWSPTAWLFVFLVWGLSAHARSVPAPPWFPNPSAKSR